MNLWKLGWVDGLDKSLDYDCAYAFVVRAPTEYSARNFAANDAGDEGVEVWMDSKRTTCVRLLARGKSGVIARDFHAG